MKKMSRKIAAIIAAAMTATTMGAMNAFADEISVPDTVTHYSDDNDSKSAYVALNIEPYAGVSNPATAVNTDENKHIWSITIDNDALTWKVARNTDGGTFDLEWDTTDHRYKVKNATGETVSFSMYNNDAAAKTVSLTNNSNFGVDFSTAITYTENKTPQDTDLIKVTANAIGNIPVYTTQNSNGITSTVTFDVSKLTDADWTLFGLDGTTHNLYRAGTLTYTFNVGESNGTPVADADQYSGLGNNNAEP